MEFITPYIILYSMLHIMWDLFYFETTSIFLIPSLQKTHLWLVVVFDFLGVSAPWSSMTTLSILVGVLHLSSRFLQLEALGVLTGSSEICTLDCG